MQDMLVRLYNLPDAAPMRARLAEQGIIIRRCNPYETHILTTWVGQHFSPKWVSECMVAMAHQPAGCFIATRQSQIIGFVCIDTTARGFIGPLGVGEEARGAGVGKALFVTGLEHMRAMGYAYAVIGGVGPAELYQRWVGATFIEDSTPGIYADLLPEPPRV